MRGAREHNLHERRPRPAARPADRVHRPVGFGQVVARVRHDLRRGPAPLRRVAVGVRPAVPRPDGQARRRLHRGSVAGDLDRPEVGVAQPALDGRHDHRDLRLPPAAVRAHRGAALPELRAADHTPDAAADRRPRAAAARGHALPGARAGRARPQGRVLTVCSTSSPGRASRAPASTASSSTCPPSCKLERYEHHTIEVVVDRLVRRAGIERRLTDSLETALRSPKASPRSRSSRGRRTTTSPRRSRSPSTSRARTAGCRSTSSRRATSRSTRRTARARRATVSARSSRSTPSSSSPTTTSRSTTARSRRGRASAASTSSVCCRPSATSTASRSTRRGRS